MGDRNIIGGLMPAIESQWHVQSGITARDYRADDSSRDWRPGDRGLRRALVMVMSRHLPRAMMYSAVRRETRRRSEMRGADRYVSAPHG